MSKKAFEIFLHLNYMMSPFQKNISKKSAGTVAVEQTTALVLLNLVQYYYSEHKYRCKRRAERIRRYKLDKKKLKLYFPSHIFI